MTNPPIRPLRRRVQARIFRVLNVVIRAVLGLPLRTPLSRRLMLVHHIGRRTGKRYRQPVSYVQHGSTLLTPGGGRWTRNLRDGDPVSLRLRGRDVIARPELVSDPAEVDRLFAFMASRNPALRRFVPIPRTADGHLDPAALRAAIDYGFRIVRWHLDPAAGATDPRFSAAAAPER